jgi:hypothetical protein
VWAFLVSELEFRGGTSKVSVSNECRTPRVVTRRKVRPERHGLPIPLLRAGPIATQIEYIAPEAVAIDERPHADRFLRRIQGSLREFLQAEKDDQQVAEACKRLIKNCIICWNYLYLSQKLAEIDDLLRRAEFIDAFTHGSAVSWRHVNLLGEYDFSEEKLKDSVGIKPPKLID